MELSIDLSLLLFVVGLSGLVIGSLWIRLPIMVTLELVKSEKQVCSKETNTRTLFPILIRLLFIRRKRPIRSKHNVADGDDFSSLFDFTQNLKKTRGKIENVFLAHADRRCLRSVTHSLL